MDSIVPSLANTVYQAKTLEQLARPLLALLQRATGMESTYLTRIEPENGQQIIQFATNEGTLTVTEGLSVKWEDTLCKRALEENCYYCDDVPQHWGDSQAAKALHIQSYMSTPIRNQAGELLGTLCAISSEKIAPSDQIDPLLKLISSLLSFSVEREQLLHDLQQTNHKLMQLSLTDPLTELPNRRAFLNDLPRLFATAKREKTFVLLGVADLDNLKTVNDQFGHHAGDLLLKTVSWRLRSALRETDLLGRTGGDEFFFATLGMAPDAQLSCDSEQTAQQLQSRLSRASTGNFSLDNDLPTLHYSGASIGVAVIWPEEVDIDHAMHLADQAMYRVKEQRKTSQSTT